MVQDHVHLIRQLFVNCCDQAFDRAEGIGGDGIAMRQRLLRQRLHRVFNCTARLVGLRFELLVQERCKLVALKLDGREVRCALGFGSHGLFPFLLGSA